MVSVKYSSMRAPEYALVGRESLGRSASGQTDFPRAIMTRKICISSLYISALVGILCLAIGAGFYHEAQSDTAGWIPLRMPTALKEITPLLINIAVAALTESTGFIHTTALRWALGERLIFNTNLRLFSCVPGCLAFGAISNFFNAGFLALSYCATSLIMSGLPPTEVCGHAGLLVTNCSPYVAYFSPGALIALGIGLGGNAAITTWQLRSIDIPTWSSSPLDIAWASLSTCQRGREEHRCMASVHDSINISTPMKPKLHQRHVWSAHRQVRSVFIYLWTLVILVLAWCGAIIASINTYSRKCSDDSSSRCGVFSGSSWSLLPDTEGATSLVQINTVDKENDSNSSNENLGYFLAFVLVLGFQSVLTMGLHCAELLVNLSRDEDTWREAYTTKGYAPKSALFTMLSSWKSALLLALKPIVHWVFGLGMTFYYGGGVFMRPPQLLYLSFTIITLATLGTAVCFIRPKGPQPATFGHIQTLINLIDVWSEHMYWGHKGKGTAGICHAGTADVKLEQIILTEDYAAM